MEYEKMLDRLYLSIPQEALSKERFEMPEVHSFIQGNKTFIKNFSQILKTIRREEKHILKYLTKECATAANVEEGGRLVLNSKFRQEQLQKIFNNYINDFVLCHTCKKPDTKIVELQGVKVLKCEACGATSPVKRF